MLEFDRFMLARTEKLKAEVRRAYEAFDFQAAYQRVLNFAVIDLSSLYIDVARDRLYCAAANSRERRSAQTALYNILDALVRMLAPLIPFTAEEVYSHMPGKRLASVHLLRCIAANPSWRDEELEARWERLLEVRDEALKLLEAMRQAGTIGAPLEAAISLGADGGSDSGLAETLKRYRDELKDCSSSRKFRFWATRKRPRSGSKPTAAKISLDERYLRTRSGESRNHAGRASCGGREVRAMLEVLR